MGALGQSRDVFGPGWMGMGQCDLRGHVVAELRPRLRVEPR